MQFSKKVSQLARIHGIEEKDVLFAMLTTAGASVAESFAVIFRPAATTNASLSAKASNHIGQRPGLKKLIEELNAELSEDPDNPKRKAGRPRKDKSEGDADKPIIDYTDKDAVLQELARIAERSDNDNSRLAALREIGALQRMKQEAAVEDEKRVSFYIPLDYGKCDELLDYLRRYYGEKAGNVGV